MLVGPSGCGKTTFISIVTGLLEPDEGRCHVLGQDLQELDETAKERLRGQSVGFVFQAFNLLPALSALDNVSVPLLINGMPRDAARAQARELLDVVGLSSRAEALPGQLSGGQQQRVAIARALVHDPRLIVCDEPTSSLDHHSGQEMMALLRDVAQGRERTLIVVTHDDRILGFADRIAHMDDGRISGIGIGNASEPS
jgi:putative ABC transport system ATP-binding protein